MARNKINVKNHLRSLYFKINSSKIWFNNLFTHTWPLYVVLLNPLRAQLPNLEFFETRTLQSQCSGTPSDLSLFYSVLRAVPHITSPIYIVLMKTLYIKFIPMVGCLIFVWSYTTQSWLLSRPHAILHTTFMGQIASSARPDTSRDHISNVSKTHKLRRSRYEHRDFQNHRSYRTLLLWISGFTAYIQSIILEERSIASSTSSTNPGR